MNTGKSLRLRRIMDAETGTTVMFAFSHGTSAPEVLPGLEAPTRVIEAAASGGADCVFLAPGLIEAMGDLTAGVGVITVSNGYVTSGAYTIQSQPE